MAYEKLSEEQRAALLKMDADAETFKAKIRADIITDPSIKPGLLYIVKLAKAWNAQIGHKRIGKTLIDLAPELL
jgi:hypothetical protein